MAELLIIEYGILERAALCVRTARGCAHVVKWIPLARHPGRSDRLCKSLPVVGVGRSIGSPCYPTASPTTSRFSVKAFRQGDRFRIGVKTARRWNYDTVYAREPPARYPLPRGADGILIRDRRDGAEEMLLVVCPVVSWPGIWRTLHPSVRPAPSSGSPSG